MKTLLLLFLVLFSPVLAQPGNYRVMNKGREGELLNVAEYLTKGKLNLVEFSSLACPSCQALKPKLSALAEKNPELVVSQVMIDRPGAASIDWQSPLARQYELRSVPYFKVYDSTGKLLADGEAARKMIAKMLLEADIL